MREVYKVRMFLQCQHALRTDRIRYNEQYVLDVQLLSRY
jgi:hypothetical protein